jgi:hypothetical protein
MKNTKVKKYYSGSVVGTVITLVSFFLIIRYLILDAVSVGTASAKDAYLLVALVLLFFCLIIYAFGYGTHQLSVANRKIIYKGFFQRRIIDIDTIKGIRKKVASNSPLFRNHRSSGQVSFLILFEDGNVEDSLKIPMGVNVFGKKIFSFLKEVLKIRPSTPVYEKSFYGLLKKEGIKVENPMEKFPYQIDKFKKKLKRLGLIPRFDETKLFLMSISLIIIFFTNPTVLHDLRGLLDVASESRKGGNLIIFVFFMLIGALFSLFHAFSKEEKKKRHKYYMIIFGVGMTSGSAIAIAIHEWINLNWQNGLIILWNLLYGFWLLYTFTEYMGEKSISNKDAEWHELIIGVSIIALIIYLLQVRVDSHWGIVYSTCVAYSTLVNKFITSFLNKKLKLSQLFNQ